MVQPNAKLLFEYRSHTIKTKSRLQDDNIVGKSNTILKKPQGIGKIRQSIEPAADPEDFRYNDIDEQVSSHKKMLLHRNIEWKNGSEGKIQFPIETKKDSTAFKKQMNKYKKSHTKR